MQTGYTAINTKFFFLHLQYSAALLKKFTMRIVSLLFLIVFGTNCDAVNGSIAGLKTPASSGKESENQIGVDSRQAEEYAEKAVIKNGSKEGSRQQPNDAPQHPVQKGSHRLRGNDKMEEEHHQ